VRQRKPARNLKLAAHDHWIARSTTRPPVRKREIAALTATVKNQAAQIQKVSAQIEVTKPAPQVVNNNQ
jgi:hypothetical protein